MRQLLKPCRAALGVAFSVLGLIAASAAAVPAAAQDGTTSMPAGALDVVSVDGTAVTTAGWAADPASPQRDVLVDSYVDGECVATSATDGPRPDVAEAFPEFGDSTAFSSTFGVSPGTHEVCAFAIDADALNTLLGCEVVTIS